MKEFMMIFIGADYEELGLSPEQLQERMGKWFAWSEKMGKQGIIRSGEALHAGGKTIAGPKRVVSDGPYSESKEIIGGFYVISVEDMETAMEVAQDFPDYDLGGIVEIREVMKFDQH